ncbi:MAG: AraC family transcriptional regulator [bacterium]|nr:MAG: AraC family transcriptional regulator [bacterium]
MTNENPQYAFLFTKLSPSPNGKDIPFQSLPYYSILWIQKGKGLLHVDFEVYPFEDNTICFLSPGQFYRLELKNLTEGIILCFKDEFFCLGEDHSLKPQYDFFFNLSTQPSTLKMDTQMTEYIQVIMDKIAEEYDSSSNLRDELLRSYVKILLLKLSEVLSELGMVPKAFDKRNETLFEFKQLIETHYTKSHRVADYARRLNITGKCLNEMVKRAMGKTATQMIHERIVLEAKRHLYHSSLSIKELTKTLGFDDPYYFSRFFSKWVGLSPQKFRERHRNPSITNSDSSIS